MDSKSELKRICTLRPLEMAARIYELEETFKKEYDFHLADLKRLQELEAQLVTIQDMFSDALQSDLEHGVKWLNENASKEFHEKYPELTQALNRLSDMK
jgi:hypothetical protein